MTNLQRVSHFWSTHMVWTERISGHASCHKKNLLKKTSCVIWITRFQFLKMTRSFWTVSLWHKLTELFSRDPWEHVFDIQIRDIDPTALAYW